MIKEKCGVFGIYNIDSFDCARVTYAGLYSLQHRGQESCGIAINNNREISCYKDLGHVSEVFHERELDELTGQIAVGHVMYSAGGQNLRANVQPLVSKYIKGTLAICHNGSITNSDKLRHELELAGAIFQTSTDTEVMMHLIARERLKCGSVEEAVSGMMDKVKGSYSMVIMSPTKLIAVRDPFGMRPLCLGRMENSYVVASESCAFDTVGAKFIRDIEPGEILVIDKSELRSLKGHCKNKSNLCIFEYIYFARSDSVIDGMSVHEARKHTGRILAEQYPVDADLVIGVPDSGIDSAIGYANKSGIPYGKGLIINRYVGRTFIQPTQQERAYAVRLKINVLRDTVRGKRIVMLDDSIVRGTTCANLVSMLKDAGAAEVHMRISSPPFMWPCYFGTDVASKDQLLACNNTIEEIRQIIGADSLAFFPVERLKEIIPECRLGFCDACFTGKYPFELE
ncbi:MAG: amidophosphoribosyltransferase [Clostridiales bacterium]|jgi:amidophosphoribosyltransferase|nr:amidophosphoribosyltransferase [Clostridiales bacterium]